ncbi:unnamed protein product, partial [Polarella glacialis]
APVELKAMAVVGPGCLARATSAAAVGQRLEAAPGLPAPGARRCRSAASVRQGSVPVGKASNGRPNGRPSTGGGPVPHRN